MADSGRHIEPLLPSGAPADAILSVPSVTLVLSALAPALTADAPLTAPPVTVVLSAQAPALSAATSIAVPPAALVLSALAPAVTVGAVSLAVPPAVLKLIAVAPAVGTGTSQNIMAVAPVLNLIAVAPAVNAEITITVSAATIKFIVPPATLSAAATIAVTAAIIKLSANAPVLTSPASLAVPAAVIKLSALAPQLIDGSVIFWFKAGPGMPIVRVAAVVRQIDPANFSGTFYFEAMLRTTQAIRPAYARLWNRTDSLPVASSVVSTTGINPTRVRSGAVSLSGNKEYEVEFGGQPGGVFNWHGADVIVDTP